MFHITPKAKKLATKTHTSTCNWLILWFSALVKYVTNLWKGIIQTTRIVVMGGVWEKKTTYSNTAINNTYLSAIIFISTLPEKF